MEQFQRIYVQQRYGFVVMFCVALIVRIVSRPFSSIRRPVLLRNATATWPVMKWWKRKKFQYLYNTTTMDVFVNEKAVGGVRYTEKLDLHK
jgi:hypothetical protein